jgi:hypothetical protein
MSGKQWMDIDSKTCRFPFFIFAKEIHAWSAIDGFCLSNVSFSLLIFVTEDASIRCRRFDVTVAGPVTLRRQRIKP